MKILNDFAQLQTKENFIKTIEIRKENSFDKIWKKYVSFSNTSYKDGTISDDIYYTDTNGLLSSYSFWDCECNDCKECERRIINNKVKCVISAPNSCRCNCCFLWD